MSDKQTPYYNLGKASFIAGLIACVLMAIILKWLDEFKKLCPPSGCGWGHQLFGEMWDLMFGFGVFAAPPIAVAGLGLGIAGHLRKQEKYKKFALAGAWISALVLAVYLLCWMLILLL